MKYIRVGFVVVVKLFTIYKIINVVGARTKNKKLFEKVKKLKNLIQNETKENFEFKVGYKSGVTFEISGV